MGVLWGLTCGNVVAKNFTWSKPFLAKGLWRFCEEIMETFDGVGVDIFGTAGSKIVCTDAWAALRGVFMGETDAMGSGHT